MVTAPLSEAAILAKRLVEERLVACVNIVPAVQSVYYWDGKVVSDDESLLVIKTVPEQFETLERRIKELHSYDLPEIIALPVSAGSTQYLDWLAASVAEKAKSNRCAEN